MTDAEIIKALECCCKNNNCEGCPLDYLTFSSQCASELAVKSLDLINRQQAEIDELKHERKVLIEDIHCSADKINEQLEEIEKLERTISYLEGVCESTPDKVRADEIKEFAEKVKANKNKLFNYIFSSRGFDEQIDNLVKEMVGKE